MTTELKAAYEKAVDAMAEYIALNVVACATDEEEDPLTFVTDAETVEVYAHYIAKDISDRIPQMVELLVRGKP